MYVFSLRPNPQSIGQNQHYFLPSQLRRFRLEKAGRRRIRGLDHIGSDEPFFPFVSLRGRRMLAPASAMSERKPGYGATMVCRWGDVRIYRLRLFVASSHGASCLRASMRGTTDAEMNIPPRLTIVCLSRGCFQGVSSPPAWFFC